METQSFYNLAKSFKKHTVEDDNAHEISDITFSPPKFKQKHNFPQQTYLDPDTRATINLFSQYYIVCYYLY
jgi:hypothetical protein